MTLCPSRDAYAAARQGLRAARETQHLARELGDLPIADYDELGHGVAFSHDGRQLASASQDGTVRLWDARDPDRLPVGRTPLQSPAWVKLREANG